MRRGPKPDPTSARSRVMLALRACGGPVRDIAQRADVDPVRARRALESFESQGRATCDRDVRPRVWSPVLDPAEESERNERYAEGRRAYTAAIARAGLIDPIVERRA